MNPKRCLIVQAFRAADVFYDDGLGNAVEFLLLGAAQILTCIDKDWQVRMFIADLFDQVEARNIGKHQIQNDTGEVSTLQCFASSLPVAAGVSLAVPFPISSIIAFRCTSSSSITSIRRGSSRKVWISPMSLSNASRLIGLLE